MSKDKPKIVKKCDLPLTSARARERGGHRTRRYRFSRGTRETLRDGAWRHGGARCGSFASQSHRPRLRSDHDDLAFADRYFSLGWAERPAFTHHSHKRRAIHIPLLLEEP